MKQRSIEIATFVLVLLPLLLILGSPTFSSQALGLKPVIRPPAVFSAKRLYAVGGVYDGWILESSLSSHVGGSMSAASPSVFIGSDKTGREFRAILTFNTSVLPPKAYVDSATLYLKGNGFVGTSPFSFGELQIDTRRGAFSGNKALQLSDFQAPANSAKPNTLTYCGPTAQCVIDLDSQALPYINLSGVTQFRLRFAPYDDGDSSADYYRVFSADAPVATDRPMLVIRYYP